MSEARMAEFGELKGLTLSSVDESVDEIVFETTEGRRFRMYHDQSCCESVYVEDVVGDWDTLLGAPLLMADEASGGGLPKDYDESFTWTFYKLATVNGFVDIRWYGTSSGYYSESVAFSELTD